MTNQFLANQNIPFFETGLTPAQHISALNWSNKARLSNNAPYEIALIGDSRFDQAHRVSGKDLQTENISIAAHIEYLSFGAYSVPADLNFAVGGSRSHQWFSQADAFIASRARVAVMINPVNDFGGANMSAQQSMANIQVILNAITQAGKAVVFLNGTPNNNAHENPQGHETLRDWIMSLSDTYPNVIPVNTWDAFVSGGNETLQTDDLHWNASGGALVGKLTKLALDGLPITRRMLMHIGAAYEPTFSPKGNLLINTALAGSGGTVRDSGQGQAPDNFAHDLSGSNLDVFTHGVSVGAYQDGTPYVEQFISGTPNDGDVNLFLEQRFSTEQRSQFANGDKLTGYVDMEILSLQNCQGIAFGARGQDGTGSYFVIGNDKHLGESFLPSDYANGRLVIPTFEMEDVDTLTDMRVRTAITLTNNAPADVRVRFSNFNFLKV